MRAEPGISVAIFCEVMSDITVYTTEPCSFCNRVKGLLRSRGAHYTEVNLAKDPEGRAELARRTGMMSFPQVLVGDRADRRLRRGAGRRRRWPPRRDPRGLDRSRSPCAAAAADSSRTHTCPCRPRPSSRSPARRLRTADPRGGAPGTGSGTSRIRRRRGGSRRSWRLSPRCRRERLDDSLPQPRVLWPGQ